MTRNLLILACSLVSLAASAMTEQSRDRLVSIYVGPQTREGFVDVDRGVLDAIKDLQGVIRRDRQTLELATRCEDAAVILEVVHRGSGAAGSGGAIAAPVGGIGVIVPIETKVLRAMLRAGTYERPIVVEADDGWRDIAEKVVAEVKTWVLANRERLSK